MAIFVKLDGIAAMDTQHVNRIANQNPQNLGRTPEADGRDVARASDSASFGDSARGRRVETDAARLGKPSVYDAGGMSRSLEGDPDRPFAVDLRH